MNEAPLRSAGAVPWTAAAGARRFVAQRGPTRVVFATGCSDQLAREVEPLGFARVLVVCSPRREREAGALAAQLGERAAGVLAIAEEHVPAAIAAAAVDAVDAARADGVLALGGGSAIGLAKAVAAERPVRALAVPTTYSGSEMTSIYGITHAQEKRTARAERVRPALVLYDPALTCALPRATSLASLWNALAHCVEALWWPDVDPVAELAAERGLQLIARCLPALARDPQQLAAREQALEGAYLAGLALGETGTALQHKLAHVLGGTFALPHAATHAVLLPHVVRYNATAAPRAVQIIAAALGATDAADALAELAVETAVPTTLIDLGFARDQIDAAVDKLLAAGGYNPAALERQRLRSLLSAACG